MGAGKRRKRSKAERRQIVEETLKPGISVARVAQAHGVNANQIFQWRKLYREGAARGRAFRTPSRQDHRNHQDGSERIEIRGQRPFVGND